MAFLEIKIYYQPSSMKTKVKILQSSPANPRVQVHFPPLQSPLPEQSFKQNIVSKLGLPKIYCNLLHLSFHLRDIYTKNWDNRLHKFQLNYSYCSISIKYHNPHPYILHHIRKYLIYRFHDLNNRYKYLVRLDQ